MAELLTRIVRWDITGRCNLTCLHCYNAKLSSKELSTRDIYTILEKLLDNGLQELNLSGREPTIRNDLPQIILWCHLHKVKVNLTTNGTLLNYRMLSRFASFVNMIVYSLDGSEESTHDAIRGKGNFSKTINNIKACRRFIRENKINLKIGISSTLSRNNYKNINEMVKLCSSLNVSFLSINPISFCGSATESKEMLQLGPNQILATWNGICLEYSRIRPAFELHLGTLPMETRLLNIKYKLNLPVIQNTCSAGRSLYINPLGQAYPCYMIPAVVNIVPELTNYMKSWEILKEPISSGEKSFSSFIRFTHKHTQENSEYCADCAERTYCKLCPVLALSDKVSIVRCKIAQRRLTHILSKIDSATIPCIKSMIEWKISRNKLITCFKKGDYVSKKEFKINPLARSIWHLINGKNTLRDIGMGIAESQHYPSSDKLDSTIIDFVIFLIKEGIVEKKCNLQRSFKE
jgi:radical SAM protein with 4Fe4S-binding SPASM domain